MSKAPIQGLSKLLLLHGAGIASSRKKLVDLKGEFDQNNVVVFGEGSDFADIKNNLISTSLFSSDRLVILENPPEDFTDYTLTPNPYTLILWFDHEISERKRIFEWVKKQRGKVLFFEESKEVSVFPFLDFLAEGNKRAFLEPNKLKGSGFDVFYFITMTFYLLRSLVFTPKNTPRFVQDKLQRQRKRFNMKSLQILYRNILEIEFKVKSGLLEKEQAEFLLLNLFV